MDGLQFFLVWVGCALGNLAYAALLDRSYERAAYASWMQAWAVGACYVLWVFTRP